MLKEEETRRVGPAGGGGSHPSAGHHHLLLLLTNTLPLSAPPRSARLSLGELYLDQDSHIDRRQNWETASGTCRIGVPAAGSRHAGHGEDGRARSSGLERILQRGGLSLSARFTATVNVKDPDHTGQDQVPINRKFIEKFSKQLNFTFCPVKLESRSLLDEKLR